MCVPIAKALLRDWSRLLIGIFHCPKNLHTCVKQAEDTCIQCDFVCGGSNILLLQKCKIIMSAINNYTFLSILRNMVLRFLSHFQQYFSYISWILVL
jgi:hypothetical protein